MKRPLLLIVCLYSSGIAFSSFFNLPVFSILLILSLFCFGFFLKEKSKAFLILSIFIIVFLSGSAYSHLKSLRSIEPFKPYAGESLSFDAEIASQPDIREKKTNYVVIIKNIYFHSRVARINAKALLSIYNINPESENKIYLFGDLIKGRGKFTLPSPAKNVGAFNYRRYLSSQGVYAAISTMPSSLMSNGKADLNPFLKFSLTLRERILKIIDASVPSEEAGLLKGIVIGERNGLSDQAAQNFNISGLTHIVCVSGANIAYIAAACIFLFGFLKVKPVFSSFLTIFIIIIFTYITGCSPSVVRAAIMGIVLLIGNILQRKSDPLTSISAASLFILMYNPFTLYDVGFQLSFGGTIGIVMFYKTLFSYFGYLPKFINEVLSASLSAQLVVDPIVALYFNKVSLIAIVSNLIVVPFTGVVTILGFIMSIVGQFSILLARFVGGLTYFFLAFMLRASEISARIPFATIQVITPRLLFLIGYYSLLYILLYHIPIKKPSSHFYRAFSVSLGIAAIIIAISVIIPKPLQINFLDIGQGDACFIKTPSGRTMLIDGGGAYPGSTVSFDPGATIIPFILDNGKTSIDIAVLSHPHGDHIQGLIEVVDAMNVKKLITGPQFQSNQDLEKLLEICKKRGTEVIQVSEDDSLALDNTKLEFLYPSLSGEYVDSSDLNTGSLVFRLSYKNFSALFTGDIPSTIEEKILAENSIVHTDILKVAHHGSVYSSSAKFLEAAAPSVCIISVGKNNFGHPSPVVIDRIKSVHSLIYRTDLNGGINIAVYKDKYTLAPTIN